MKHLDLFSGIGGFALAARQVGWKTVGFCEIDPFCQKVLRKHWAGVQIYDDIRDYQGTAADIITGGFPCQDISVAGKRIGIEGKRSSLWTEFARLIGKIRPKFAVVENTTGLLNRGMGAVLGDLAKIGYDAEWHCLPASILGAPHHRDRVWIVAYRDGIGRNWASGYLERKNEICEGPEWLTSPFDGWRNVVDWLDSVDADYLWEVTNRETLRVDDGISRGLDRDDIGALGNAIVPQAAEVIFKAIDTQQRLSS